MKAFVLSLATAVLVAAGPASGDKPAPTDDEAQIIHEVENAVVRQEAVDQMGGMLQSLARSSQLAGRGPQAEAGAYIESIEGVALLTDEQKERIVGVFNARAKALADFESKNADRINAVRIASADARKKRDEEAMAKAREDASTLNAAEYEIRKKASEDLDKVLTREQRAKLDDAKGIAFITSIAAPAKLTRNQISQLKAAWAEGAGGNQRAVKELLPKILTPQQQAAIDSDRTMAFIKRYFKTTELTEEQLQQIQTASDKMSRDESLGTVQRFVKLVIQAKGLLTEGQKEAMKPPSTQAGSPK